jgi:hypothetical protein
MTEISKPELIIFRQAVMETVTQKEWAKICKRQTELGQNTEEK